MSNNNSHTGRNNGKRRDFFNFKQPRDTDNNVPINYFH